MAASGDPLILYDLTRLVAMRLSPVATGIDRIDLHLARAVFGAYGERCLPVVKVGPRAFLADRRLAQKLLRGLERAWFGGSPHDLHTASALEVAGLTKRIDGLLVEGPGTVAKARWTATSRLSGSLKCALNGLSRAGVFLWSRAGNAFREDVRKTLPHLLTDGKVGVYVVCSHGGIARCDGLLHDLRRGCGLKTVAYLHDLLPLDYPEYFPPGKSQGFARFLSELKHADTAFVVNSHETARRLADYARRVKWSLGRVSVIHPGVEGRRGAPDSGIGAEGHPSGAAPYFVIVGTIEPRKNHLLILQIWRDLVRSGHSPMPHLHIVGRRGWENENVLDLLDRCETIRPYVTEHNGMPDPELQRLVRGARAVLFPSFAEGFGLPVVEALQLGTRVIASDLPAFREVAGDLPQYLDPLDAPAWRRAILRCGDETPPPAGQHQRTPVKGNDWQAQSQAFVEQIREEASGRRGSGSATSFDAETPAAPMVEVGF